MDLLTNAASSSTEKNFQVTEQEECRLLGEDLTEKECRLLGEDLTEKEECRLLGEDLQQDVLTEQQNGIYDTVKQYDPDNFSEHSIPLSESSSRRKSKRIENSSRNSTKKKNQEKIKLYKQELEKHFDYIKTIKSGTYYPINIAIEEYRKQCPEVTIKNSSIKRHILKNYKTILDCVKLNNRWMCAYERVKEIKFDLMKYKMNRD